MSLPPGDERARGWRALAFGVLGCALLAVCLYWNRIALGGPLGQAPAWAVTLAHPAAAVLEAASGPLESDWPGDAQRHRVARFITSWTVAAALYLAACWLALRYPDGHGLSLDFVLAFSVICRVVLVASPPLLETDPRRYCWDGATLAAGVNPYRYAPLDVLLHERGALPRPPAETRELEQLVRLSRTPRIREHFLSINHPGVATVYPPGAQLLFLASHTLAPGSLIGLKTLVAIADLGVLALLAWFLRRLDRPALWIVLYGWCPLVLKEYAGTGHYDALATAALLASLAALVAGWRALAGGLAGAAVSAKLFPGAVVLVLARRYGLRGLVACGGVLACVYAPFLPALASMTASLRTFAEHWEGNASVFPLVRGLFESLLGAASISMNVTPAAAARVSVAILAILALMLISTFREEEDGDVIRKTYAALAAVFVLSPVQNPWYAGWVLPFAALAGSIAWPVLSVTMLAYYAYFSGFSWCRPLPWPAAGKIDLRLVEYLPFYGLLAAERGRRPPGRVPDPSG